MLIREQDLDYYSTVDDSNELMHYGKKGMKWGRRKNKLSIKQYNKERNSLQRSEEEKHWATSKISNLEKHNKELLKKHTFDADDGGGTKTKADEKAALKYLKNWDKIESLEDLRSTQTRKKVDKMLNDKYGKETIQHVKNKQSYIRQLKTGAAIVGAVGGYMLYKKMKKG